ncbi:MAG TPA: hypothetical protein VFA26_11735, partial [Gemmataceae bacterium]|nr:hypothetical protein [Gemmataceae bacterium]
RYAPDTRTDFLLPAEEVAVTVKQAGPDLGERQVAVQLEEDAAEHARQGKCRKLVCLVYDPEGLLREREQLEKMWSHQDGTLEVRCVIAG